MKGQKPDHTSLGTLLGWLREGRFAIPDFQREFEWDSGDIRDLIRSVFLDYYIGSLLLWKGKTENFSALSCEAIYGHDGPNNRTHIVLDGQQRLTAMYYAFIAPNKPLPNKKARFFYSIQIDDLMAGRHEEAFTSKWVVSKDWTPETNGEAVFGKHIFPCSVLGAGGFELAYWVKDYEQYWGNRVAEATNMGREAEAQEARGHFEDARGFAALLKDVTETYQVSYIELEEELEIYKVCDIFTQLNSKGVPLDVFDLMNALLKPKDIQLKRLWREARSKFAFVDTKKLNIYVLQVMSILRQDYCSPKYLYFLLPGAERQIRDADGKLTKEVLIPSVAEFRALWSRAIDAMEKAIWRLRHPQQFGVASAKYLPYVAILPVFAALQAYLVECPAELRFAAERKIRQWYWASVFTNRYSESVESTSTRDFIDLKAWISDDDAVPTSIEQFKTTFRDLELRRETKSGSAIYNGIFNLLVLAGARDWNTDSIPHPDELDDHHIVPASWGAKHLNDNSIDSILNRAPLTAETNRNVISSHLPNTYLAELINDNGEAAVRATLSTHLISPVAVGILLRDPFTAADFNQFLSERRRTILEAIESLLIKERLDLSPSLRDLDARIEAVELGLRHRIVESFDDDPALLPPHIAQRLSESVQRALKKNPALDSRRFASLTGQLDYADLRDLEQIIVSKSSWSHFEPSLKNKATLAGRFDRLAELRNGIRHSRVVDEVMQKEGEAATLWFNNLLGL